MRIAIAGTGGLARSIANSIHAETSHTVIFLSRSQRPNLHEAGFQVAVVDYTRPETLRYALLGIDTVISTVTGPNQIGLIDAAVTVNVRRFAPAEFEGPPMHRNPDDLLDRGRSAALTRLEFYAGRIEYTAFVCGIFYERFQPGGLLESQINSLPGLNGNADYLIDDSMVAQMLFRGVNDDVYVCMTAVDDVAAFVTRALELPVWGREMRICGTRASVQTIIAQISQLRGLQYIPQYQNRESLHTLLMTNGYYPATRNKINALINTIDGYYDFTWPPLPFNDLQLTAFPMWLSSRLMV